MATLVLLPGLDGTGDLFGPLLEALGSQTKVQVVRYPIDIALGYEELHSFVRSSLPMDEDYVLLGESFSGPVAIALAADAPPSLKGLVLCSTFARNPRPSLAALSVLLPLVPFQRMPAIALSQLLLGGFSTADLRRSIAKAVGQVQSAVLRARVRAVLSVDSSALLPRITVRSVYLQATKDRLVPETALAHIRALLPSISVEKVEGPHCLLQASPAAASKVIEAFMRELEVAL